MLAHYLPRSYLSGFCSLEIPDRQEPFVYFYDLAQTRWRRRSPYNLARIPDYYAIEDHTGHRHQDVEQAFSVVEGRMSRLLREKLNARQELDLVERLHVAEFVATLFLRVPVQQAVVAEQLARIGEDKARRLYRYVREDPTRLDEIKEQIRRETGVEISADFGVDDLDPDEYTIEPSRNAVVIQGFRLLDEVVPSIASMGWGLSIAPEGHSFITSDAPVFLHADGDPGDQRPVSMMDADVQLSCPLTSSVALYASFNLAELEYREVAQNTVEQLNIRTAARAETMLIANTEQPTGIDKIMEMLGRG